MQLTASDVVPGVVCCPDALAVFCPGVGAGDEKESGGKDERCELHFWKIEGGYLE